MARKKSTAAKTPPADIGLIGLAVMGQNLILNMADHGYTVAVYNRTSSKVDDFIASAKASEPSAGRLVGCKSLKKFVSSIKRPRKIVLLVKAGWATDATIESVVPYLEKGDIIIDGGNALWTDTIRREQELTAKGLRFIGSGVSGGETGARFGPSLMPGGSKEAWKELEPIWKAISAKVDRKTGRPIEVDTPGQVAKGGEPCTVHIGENGAGHYVKMVHNGIEYIDMQLICEAYMLMKNLLGMKPDAMSEVFAGWNEGDLDSYLIEITADILQQKDPMNKRRFLVDSVLDTAGQKGTGKWTSTSALDLGIPANAIAEAVFARCLSAIKEERVSASKQLRGPKAPRLPMSKAKAIEAIREALYCSKICAYAQGFQLMAEAAREYDWKLDFGKIAKIFRGGCIIRARFLQKITEAYKADRRLQNLMLDPYFKKALHGGQGNWRSVVTMATNAGVPIPAFSSALAYFDGYRTAVLPANLLQAQRDYFGAHTFERTDKPRGQFFHVDWPEPGRPISKS
ncbi:NADP-dependent phosphogluconate dehydrogenase [Mucisphaera calidilacus]|uniref:6-phosphogluconate dehydrogenase, decarboxylating n=1 Tax=Mucisphaera calidilacus TaxID=2527982 RepID=A0A518BZL6_9BACT|nr:NADP-dependent phosphogluconate dehydrogenase [Mucisphaera calidilacus]QDU72416.1 6-phosphogluconate dehydrogenase, NADP(+)-dependent, decarboxylating [Mucisphaera calidilacus]